MEQYPRNRFTFSLVAGWNKSTTASLFSFSLFYLKASGHPSTGPHQTLQPCLQILFGGRKKDSILHREVVHAFFPSLFHTLFETQQKQNIQRKSDGAKLPTTYTWLCFLNYLSSAVSLKQVGVYCMSLSMTVVKQYPKFGFLLWRSAALPFNFTSSVRLPLRSGEIQLDLQQLFRGTDDFLFKFVDKGQNSLSWTDVCHRYASPLLC